MKKGLILLMAIALIIIFSIGSWWIAASGPVNKQDTSQITFVVDKGEGTHTIADGLLAKGLIKNPLIFIILVKQMGFDGKIQAGNYQLSPSQSPQEIAQVMIKGSQDVRIRITEGKRATEIAEIFQTKLRNYDLSWKDKLVQNEGYLFPDTYDFPPDATVDQVITIMKENFDLKYAKASDNTDSKLSQQDSVILASIVEREGKSADEMKMIASVLENRLNIGMALQADATIQYALGSTINWWPTPTQQNLTINSPYNTYRNPGLPPTPISNPGLNALIAVFHPANTNYLYYFTDGKGTTHYAKTLDEQNRNIAKYGL